MRHLVAIYKTSAGLGILQQFTTDKRLLAALQPNAMEDSVDPALALRMRLSEEQANRSRQDITTAGSLSTARFIAQGLADLPGRKSIIYFSESLQLHDQDIGPQERNITALRDLADLANRAAVFFYTIDPRGLVSFALTAADSPSSNPTRANTLIFRRTASPSSPKKPAAFSITTATISASLSKKPSSIRTATISSRSPPTATRFRSPKPAPAITS